MSAKIIEIMKNPFENLILKLEEIVRRANVSYIDACVHLSESTGIELEALADIIIQTPSLKTKLAEEAANLNFLKKG